MATVVKQFTAELRGCAVKSNIQVLRSQLFVTISSYPEI